MQKEFPEFRDPFLELRKPFVTPKEKLKTFNLKQIVTKGGQVLMNMLERLLETTEIDAKDVETEVTLMEHACQTCNLQLAKLCYRRGANLAALTKRGSSYFNIATQNKNYPLMEFLCMYGGAAKVPMKVNHQDAEGRTALHVAAGNDDVDSICRLIEWGIDVNLHDYKKRTPLHTAARNGHYDATMLLLEVGADLNAKDEKEYTAVAHAEARNHFALMDRLVSLGGTGHGLSASKGIATNAQPPKKLGELAVTAMMLRSSSLGRLGKVQVKGMPGMLQSRPHTRA
jgi:ankyrin repeat protein